MTRRSGQNGTVAKRTLLDGTVVWRGRWLEDVAGQYARVKRSKVLGPASGKDALTKSRAERTLREMLDKKGINSLSYIIPSSNPSACRTFAEASIQWEKGALELVKPSTRRTMKSQLRVHLRPALGKVTIDKLTPEVMQAYIIEWHKAGCKRNTIKNLVNTVSLVRGQPFGKGTLKFPSQMEAEKEASFFTAVQMSAIVSHSRAVEKNSIYWTFFATAAGTGMRSGELRGLRVGDVDLVNAIIHVRRSVWEGKEQSPKSKNGYRKIGIDRSLVQILKEHLGDRTLGYVFMSHNATPLCANNLVERHLWPVLESLKIPRCGLHAFRHGRVSFLVENEVPVNIIKHWIGHGSQKMIDHYTHSRPAYHQKVLATLPPIIENPSTYVDPSLTLDRKARAA